jgi:hypothetical protein
LAAELDKIIKEKDGKLKGHTTGYDEIYLAIHSDEMMIDGNMISAATELRQYKPNNIDRVVIVLSYRPWTNGNNGYPMFEV